MAECPFCELAACKECVKQYLLGENDDPHCMQCRRRFDREVLCRLLPRAFVDGDLRRHREGVLLERERAQMPETQAYVRQETAYRANKQQLEAVKQEGRRLRAALKEAQRVEDELRRQLRPELEDRREFRHPCAQAGCRGFLSTAWRCGLCDRHTCRECGAACGATPPGQSGHACDPADVASAALVRRECRKCPGCAAQIFKVDGCDQMWCTACQTPFSWRTGRVVNGVVHNPHYYEFQRRAPGGLARAPGDVPCGGAPGVRQLTNLLRPLPGQLSGPLLQYHRLAAHVRLVELPRVRPPSGNRDLRVRYMLQELTEEQFRSQLQRREKRAAKLREMELVYTMFADTSEELLRRLAGGLADPEPDGAAKAELAAGALGEARQLAGYANEALMRVSRTYGCVVRVFVPGGMRGWSCTGRQWESPPGLP